LLDITTGAIWEVKPITVTTGSYMDAALRQLQRYASSTQVLGSRVSSTTPDFHIYRGNPLLDGLRLDGQFNQNINRNNYNIVYQYLFNGIIAYTYTRNNEQPRTHRIAIEGLAEAAAAGIALATLLAEWGKSLGRAATASIPLFIPTNAIDAFQIFMDTQHQMMRGEIPMASLNSNNCPAMM